MLIHHTTISRGRCKSSRFNSNIHCIHSRSRSKLSCPCSSISNYRSRCRSFRRRSIWSYSRRIRSRSSGSTKSSGDNFSTHSRNRSQYGNIICRNKCILLISRNTNKSWMTRCWKIHYINYLCHICFYHLFCTSNYLYIYSWLCSYLIPSYYYVYRSIKQCWNIYNKGME